MGANETYQSFSVMVIVVVSMDVSDDCVMSEAGTRDAGQKPMYGLRLGR